MYAHSEVYVRIYWSVCTYRSVRAYRCVCTYRRRLVLLLHMILSSFWRLLRLKLFQSFYITWHACLQFGSRCAQTTRVALHSAIYFTSSWLTVAGVCNTLWVKRLRLNSWYHYIHNTALACLALNSTMLYMCCTFQSCCHYCVSLLSSETKRFAIHCTVLE